MAKPEPDDQKSNIMRFAYSQFRYLIAFALFALALCPGDLHAQEPPSTVLESPEYEIEESTGQNNIIHLRPLEELLEDALRNSPLLKSQKINVDNLGEQLKMERRNWANFVGLDASYQYGNGAWVGDIEGGAGGPATVFRTNRENSFYRVGVGLRLPLGEFVTRGARTQLLKNQMEQEKYNRQEIEMGIRERVIQEYQNFKLQIRLMEVKSEELEFHRVAVKLAEQYFREGALNVEEFSSTFRERSRAEAELEKAKVQARLSYLLLKELVGVEIRKE